MSALGRLINNKLHQAGMTSFRANKDGSLQTDFIHTNFITGNAPLRLQGFSVGFKINKADNGSFEIVKKETQYHGAANINRKIQFSSKERSEIADTATTLETAKSKCLDAFKGHLGTQQQELAQRTIRTMSVVVAPKAVPA